MPGPHVHDGDDARALTSAVISQTISLLSHHVNLVFVDVYSMVLVTTKFIDMKKCWAHRLKLATF